MPKEVENSKEKEEQADQKPTEVSQNEPIDTEEEFDFGGLPKDVPFKRNIGCGG